jgi:hypothetical protein
MEMIEREDRRVSGSRKLKTFVGLIALAFAVTLAVIVGNRLSDQALAVLAGAVCGVGAAIPTSLLIVAITRRREQPQTDWNSSHQPPLYQQQGAYPPVIVVAPPGVQQQPYGWNGFPPSLAAPTQRQFTVVGGAPINKEAAPYERYF